MPRQLLLFILLVSACKTIRPNSDNPPPIPVHGKPDVIINHQSGLQSPIGLIRRRTGETVWIEIINTNTSQCYTFNAKAAPIETKAAEGTPPMNETADFVFTYDGTPTKITIEAYRKDETCPDLTHTANGKYPPWEVTVDNAGWDLNFSGGFTIDTLTDPVYGLVPTSKALDPTQPNNKTQGFTVERFRDQQDRYKLGAAAMVHLIHTDPEYLGRASINWVPVAFGLGVNQGSQVRYFVGTGVKFNKKLFLSTGPVFGSVRTLPAGLSADKTSDASFTTNPNALASMPTRVSKGWYFAIAYTFTGTAEPFQAAFNNVKPVPTATTQKKTDFTLAIAPKENYVNNVYTVTITLAATGQSETIGYRQDLNTNASAASVAQCKDDHQKDCGSKVALTADTTRHLMNGTVAMTPGSTYNIDITQTLAADAQPQDLTATIYHLGSNVTIASQTITLPPRTQRR